MSPGYRFTSPMSKTTVLLCIIQLTSIYGFPSDQVRQYGAVRHGRGKRDATVSFRTRPSNQTAMLGDTVILHCAAHEQNDISVTWYKGGKALTPPFTRTIFVLFNNDLLVIANRDNADKYTCELKRGNTRISADAWITIHSEMRFLEAPVDATVQFGESHVFRCSAIGADRITWNKDGRPPSSFIDGERVLQNRGDLVLTSVTLTDTGRYTCKASRDSDGHTTEAKTTLVVDVDIDGVCGRPFHATGSDGFIVGGTEVEPGAFPWQAMLWDIRPTRNRFFCSGSLINKRWVITAAHCIRELGLTEQDFIVRLGKHTSVRGVLEANERSYIVERIIVHPDFNGDTYESDVALLQLALPEVTFTEYILPICLPEIPEARRLIRPGNIGTVTGWGAQAVGEGTSEKLMKVSLPVVSLRRCRDSHPQYAQEISQNMFCAGRREGGKDACEGDSGGPFAAFDNGRWHLLGVVSWGDGCALRGKYGVYTRLHRFRDWITEQTEEQEVIDGCASNPCQHGGVCVRQQAGYTCECPAGRKGTHCEQAVEECTSAPCRNGGRCVEGHDLPSWLVLRHQGYFCECLEGWEGRNCEQAISACASNPCQQGGQCMDTGNSYSCDCPSGYTGENCQIDINECDRNPCRNGGNCVDKINGYVCSCQPGWEGKNCERSVNECWPSPCQNGGRCRDGHNSYTCECKIGWTGRNCETAVNLGCASQPCLWGATCFKSGQNGYYCNCRRDFSGKNCEIIDVSSRCSRFPRNMRRECWMRGGALSDPIAGFVN
ncbi:uncharacterized protein LOC118406418 isoform X2 [Branchiostoma floridae]|uniref:Uncharacterized protein LOC118406418 isoform X2 n=1 Tax=Branchiostoma floridae TaxID=7739 RepID=A0A9J7HML2_BRAFL|nr:uncharacterized protein LOC118406418 isoform X2 [Branchiostoma floridae]